MRVLVACEFSGTVRDAFAKLGHDAWSCDLEPSETNGNHYQGNVLDIINDEWDLMIAHPPCTHLAVSGARHFAKKIADGRQQQGIDFFMALANCNIPRYVIENPIGIMSKKWRKPDQIIQPWQYGHEASKSTCLWLKGLPLLNPTNIVSRGEFVTFSSGKRMTKWYADAAKHSPKEREKIRNKTFQGIADAMADQWGRMETPVRCAPTMQMEIGLGIAEV
jgi:site-specific DNA-cytosine methylase